METSASSKTSLRSGVASIVLATMAALGPGYAGAEILLQTNSGVWVGGTQFAHGARTMPGIIFAPEVRGNSGFLSQRALAWSSYRRGDSASGVLLVDPAGSGAYAATSPRQANVRAHLARANAYRLEYFKK